MGAKNLNLLQELQKQGVYDRERLSDIVAMCAGSISTVVHPTHLHPPRTLGGVRAFGLLAKLTGLDISTRLASLIPLRLDSLESRPPLFINSVLAVMRGMVLKEPQWALDEITRQLLGGTTPKQRAMVWLL
jgi:hypothetical protein